MGKAEIIPFPVRGARGGMGHRDFWDDPETDTAYLLLLGEAVRRDEARRIARIRAILEQEPDDQEP